MIYAREEIEARTHRDTALGGALRQLERLIEITKLGLNVEEKDAPALREGRKKPSLEERIRVLAEQRQQEST